MSAEQPPNTGLPFYEAQDVMRILDLPPRTLLDMTRRGFLLAVRLTSAGGERHNQRYAAPYVDAVRRQMDATGEADDDTYRNVALNSGGQVDAMITAFASKVGAAGRESDGVVQKKTLMELFGWKKYDTLRSQGLSDRPTTTEVLGRLAWRHAILDEVKFLTAGQALVEELDIHRALFALATRQGLVLAQRMFAGHTAREGSDYRYPTEIIDFERDYADRHGLDHYVGVRTVQSMKSRVQNRLEWSVRARFNAAVFRHADADGYLTNESAARLVAVGPGTMRSYGLQKGQRGIPRDELLDRVMWSRPLAFERTPEPGIFERQFDVVWCHEPGDGEREL